MTYETIKIDKFPDTIPDHQIRLGRIASDVVSVSYLDESGERVSMHPTSHYGRQENGETVVRQIAGMAWPQDASAIEIVVLIPRREPELVEETSGHPTPVPTEE